ncbi:hypothetical protein EDC01DRAFT_763620 [Geopyxis carbonaria]|nr:hypothetical protein EDC01DRAFT_763620 [Geopyxis carbonaria]
MLLLTPLLFLTALTLTAARENYTLPPPTSGTSLGSFIATHPSLTSLHTALQLPLGLSTAFSQLPPPGANFTFFAPSNTAFASGLSQNLKRHWLSPSAKGRADLAQVLLNHYVPVDAFTTTSELFPADGTVRRVQTAAFLYVTGKKEGGAVVLNGGIGIEDGGADLTGATGGVVHIIDGWLLPQGAWGVDEYAVPKVKQTLVAGWELPY